MHIVTGGAGFIGSAMVWKLNSMGVDDVWIVDRLGKDAKWKNLRGLVFSEILTPDEFVESLLEHGHLPEGTEAIVHMGACSSTTELDADYLLDNNFQFTKTLAAIAANQGVRTIVASSAATYGAGEFGYSDDPALLGRLRPLNMYGFSKLLADDWAARNGLLDKFASLRFFNVYGPNEYHKDDMASMVFKAFHTLKNGGKLRLFRSHRPDYRDGEQSRDFVYVKDIVDVMWWLLENPQVNGILNVGAGRDETWNQLAAAVYSAMGLPPDIEFIDMPDAIRNQYQYYTKADMTRLRQAGYKGEFRPVGVGVKDYVVNHLAQTDPYINNGKGEY